MASTATSIIGQQGTLLRGGPWKLALPLTVTVDGTARTYTSTGSLQLQWRVKGSTSTATRWNSGDGATRFETGTTNNFFLIPEDDALMGTAGDGRVEVDFECHYIDTNSKLHPVGIRGSLSVDDPLTGAPA